MKDSILKYLIQMSEEYGQDETRDDPMTEGTFSEFLKTIIALETDAPER